MTQQRGEQAQPCSEACGWKNFDIQACAQDGHDCRRMDSALRNPPGSA